MKLHLAEVQKIKKRREELGITQSHIAKVFGKTKAWWSKKEMESKEGIDPEIEVNSNQLIELNGLLFAVPFRHHIRHPYAFHTIGEAGLDFTKAVIITDMLFLSDDTPSIESKEFAIIKRNEQKLRYELSKYVNQYKRAMKHRTNPRSKNILKYSALKYFENYLQSE